MVSPIDGSQQIPVSKSFEPRQAPANPNNISIDQSLQTALKPQNIAPLPDNPALSQNQTGINSASELSKLSTRGSNLDISV